MPEKVNLASAFVPVVNCLSLAVAFRNQSGTAGHVLVPSVLFFSINYKLFFFLPKGESVSLAGAAQYSSW